MDPGAAKYKVGALLDGAMRGRTMYAVPYIMGPAIRQSAGRDGSYRQPVRGCEYADHGAHRESGDGSHRRVNGFCAGLHSVGDLDPTRRYIAHFPEERLIWSMGSGYGGNALLGKKCFALRIASWMAREQGWMAEHMLILGLEDPDGKVTYMARGISERVRQNESGDDGIGAGEPRLPRVDGGRRHCVDARSVRTDTCTRSIQRRDFLAWRRERE